MKIPLLSMLVLLMLGSCTEPKIKLRAPEQKTAQQSVPDTVKSDSGKVSAKN